MHTHTKTLNVLTSPRTEEKQKHTHMTAMTNVHVRRQTKEISIMKYIGLLTYFFSRFALNRIIVCSERTNAYSLYRYHKLNT